MATPIYNLLRLHSHMTLPSPDTYLFFICTNKDLVLLYERGIEGETSLEIDLNPNPASVRFLLNYLSS